MPHLNEHNANFKSYEIVTWNPTLLQLKLRQTNLKEIKKNVVQWAPLNAIKDNVIILL
jgi:hypothetical protein